MKLNEKKWGENYDFVVWLKQEKLVNYGGTWIFPPWNHQKSIIFPDQGENIVEKTQEKHNYVFPSSPFSSDSNKKLLAFHNFLTHFS